MLLSKMSLCFMLVAALLSSECFCQAAALKPEWKVDGRKFLERLSFSSALGAGGLEKGVGGGGGLGFSEGFFSLAESHNETMRGNCVENYGFLPCSTSLGGNLFLMLIYGFFLLRGATMISDGSELLLTVLDPGLIGGLLLPILGAFPDALLILVSGAAGTKSVAQHEVLIGMGVLAGSNVMMLTLLWGGSLIAGACDLLPNPRKDNALEAKDKTMSGFSLTHTGVTVDEPTRRVSKIMMLSAVPYIVAQIPLLIGQNPTKHFYASLMGSVVAFTGLAAYCFYQVASPWIQQRQIERARINLVRSHALRSISHYGRKQSWGALVSSDGVMNAEAVKKLFNIHDTNGDHKLSKTELLTLITTLELRHGDVLPPEAEVNAWLQEFDIDGDGFLVEDEFTKGMQNWIKLVSNGNPPVPVKARGHSHSNSWDYGVQLAEDELRRALEEEAPEEDDDENDAEDREPLTPHEVYFKAGLYLLGGAALAAIFADPLVDAITAFSHASGIPPFFVSFVVAPLATNASEIVSSILFALRKRKRNISLTYSQVYGSVTMNNTLCLGIFLAIVFLRGLVWDFSSEVSVILLVTLAIGYVGSSGTTFPLWTALVIFTGYPISIGLVAFLDYGLGWK